MIDGSFFEIYKDNYVIDKKDVGVNCNLNEFVLK